MPSRSVSAALIASLLLFFPTGQTLAQGESGITLSIAEWLPEFEAGGGWIAVPAGTVAKAPATIEGPTADLAPGAYDVYWVQAAGDTALPIALGVEVIAGEYAEVHAATGVRLETADWVPPRDPVTGEFAAFVVRELSIFAATNGGDALYLPPGTFDFYYDNDTHDGHPSIWIGELTVEAPYGGLGVQVRDVEGAIAVVSTLPGTPAEMAGLQAGDTLISVDGQDLTSLSLVDAVAFLRGEAGSEAELTVSRNGREISVTFARTTVEPFAVVQANSGIRLDSAAFAEITDDGWWGVLFAGDDGEDGFVAWSDGRTTDTLLVGPTPYDVYWDPDGSGDPELIAAGVEASGEIVTITPDE